MRVSIKGRVGRTLTLGVILLAGCTAVGPNYEPPELAVPGEWQEPLGQDLEAGGAPLQSWWSVFEDPTLDGLIERATDGNLTLEQAFARIQQSRAALGVARGERFPAVDGEGSVTRERLSEGIGEAAPPRGGQVDTFRGAGLDASWEIDFFGRISRSIEAASGEFEASVEDYRDILVVLYGDIARTYVELRTTQDRLRVANDNVRIQRNSLALAQDRYRAELAPLLDVRQAQQNLASTEATVPQFEEGIVRAINRLSVLVGEVPGALYAELIEPKPIPLPPAETQVSEPVDVVRQRPDIRRAERLLAAQTARIGVATADLYPRFSLSGMFAYETYQGSLFSGDNIAFSFGPAFSWNLFDGGRIRGVIDIQDAATEEALKAYEETVLTALEEVENAIVGFTKESERQQALVRSQDAAGQSVTLVRTLYTSGLTDFQNVLDSERTLFDQQDQTVVSLGRRTSQLVDLYTALGGGWQNEPESVQEVVASRNKQLLPILGYDLIEMDM